MNLYPEIPAHKKRGTKDGLSTFVAGLSFSCQVAASIYTGLDFVVGLVCLGSLVVVTC